MTIDAQAKTVVEKIRSEFPQVWLGGRQRMVLESAIAHALREAEARGWQGAAGYHTSQGCPAIADDESDMVLADYGQCCCDQDELRTYYRQQASAVREE